MIIRCKECGAWIASNNNMLMEEHKNECGINIKQQTVVKFKKFNNNYDKLTKCIVELDNIRFRAVVLHLRGGMFRIVSTSSPDYKDMIGKVIDASDICEVLL
ncbi:MAG: hypothetical protein KatS3mg003_0188 [Candidatus Nitrosocaldaceae archaeon]|nr:MAG: hypothetical protein KatS3mg003_0188 [Candidatus Nitrosocaldaceae archaeon]